jgi:hypothetical protein
VKRLIVATALLAVLAAPAFAQGRKPASEMTDAEKANLRATESVDRQYRNTMDKTRKDTVEAPADPWANMRGAAPPPTPAKKKN